MTNPHAIQPEGEKLLMMCPFCGERPYVEPKSALVFHRCGSLDMNGPSSIGYGTWNDAFCWALLKECAEALEVIKNTSTLKRDREIAEALLSKLSSIGIGGIE